MEKARHMGEPLAEWRLVPGADPPGTTYAHGVVLHSFRVGKTRCSEGDTLCGFELQDYYELGPAPETVNEDECPLCRAVGERVDQARWRA